MNAPKSDADTGQTAGFQAIPPNIPEHRLLRCIGRGSYGEVWLALDAMDKWTAVKVIFRSAGNDQCWYEQEFRGLKQYEELSRSDGNLMPIKNVGKNDQLGYFYYAMELADDAETRQPLSRVQSAEESGEELSANYRPRTLTEELRRRVRLTASECIEYGMSLAQSLAVLHEGRLVHRDVKPSNIIFVKGRPKLADVGLVRAADATIMSLAGTSGFVPIHGAGEPTGDIFALGKTLYIAATGNSITDFPRPAPDMESLDDEERRKRVELEAVYERACDPVPGERQLSAKGLRDELEMLLRNESIVRLRLLEEERKNFEIQRQETRKRRERFVRSSVIGFTAAALCVAALLVYNWRLRAAHESLLAELEAEKLSRMLTRRSGWAERDWKRMASSAKVRLDDALISQGTSTLSGLDARILCQWLDVEASSAAFGPDGRVALAGFSTNRAMLIVNTNRVELPVVGDGQVCWGRDGEPLICQAMSNACLLKNARTGDVLRAFPLNSHEEVIAGNVPAVAITPNGAVIAAALERSDEARVVIWNAEDGQLVGQINRRVCCLNFAPDGSLLAGGNENGQITVWRTKPVELLADLPPARRPNSINCLAFGEDRVVPRDRPLGEKRWLLAAGDSGAGIAVWDLTKRLPRAFCFGTAYNCQSLAFSPDGLTLASGGRINVEIWNVMNGAKLLTIDGLSGSDTTALSFDSTGERLAVGANALSARSGVGLIQLERSRGVQQLRGLNSHVRKLWFSSNSQSVAALADDWSLAVWDKSGTLYCVLEVGGFLADNAGAAFNQAADRIAFASGKEAQLFELPSGRILENWKLPEGYCEEVQFDEQGRLLLVRRERVPGQPRAWRWILYQLSRGQEPNILHAQSDLSYRPISMAFPSPGSRFLMIQQDRATRLNSVSAIDVASGKHLWRIEQQWGGPWDQVRMSGGGKWCNFRIGGEAMFQTVRVEDGFLASSTQRPCVALSPDGQEYVSNEGPSEQWTLRSINNNELPLHFGYDGVPDPDTFAFSPDGQLIGWGASDGTVLLANISVVRERLSTLQRRP